jgi:NADH-quinone oxidoreductase subunit H
VREQLLVWVIKASIVYGGLLATAALMTLAERKLSAWMQYRIGPNRVGPWGLLQPLADGIKFIFKEELVPAGGNPWIFRLAPVLAAMPPMLAIAVIPFGQQVTLFGVTTSLSVTDLDVGILYVLALGGLSVYGVILGGWASNSKYSLLGALRASAQMISYELSLILSILAVVVLAGSLDLQEIVASQRGLLQWNLFSQPLAFLLFVIAMFAETNRHPFDFAECEPELVGGFHTEYSAMRFALFFLGEYCAMTVMACLCVTLFLGGSDVPFLAHEHWTLGVLAFLAKAGFFLMLYIWVRWTLPRFRFDQLMDLGWKVMLPLALANLLLTGVFVSLGVDLW